MPPTPDPVDPGARADASVRRLVVRERRRRILAAVALAAGAVAFPPTVIPLTVGAGAGIGAALGSLLLLGLAVVAWPWTWRPSERRHHELAAVWRQARGVDVDAATPWPRYAAWARSDGEDVELERLACAPGRRVDRTPPSPLSVEVVARFEGDAIADAAVAMERLRDSVRELERRAEEDHRASTVEAARRAEDAALRRVDDEADAVERAAEARMRAELAEEERAERRAQAEALARALRRA